MEASFYIHFCVRSILPHFFKTASLFPNFCRFLLKLSHFFLLFQSGTVSHLSKLPHFFLLFGVFLSKLSHFFLLFFYFFKNCPIFSELLTSVIFYPIKNCPTFSYFLHVFIKTVPFFPIFWYVLKSVPLFPTFL